MRELSYLNIGKINFEFEIRVLSFRCPINMDFVSHHIAGNVISEHFSSPLESFRVLLQKEFFNYFLRSVNAP